MVQSALLLVGELSRLEIKQVLITMQGFLHFYLSVKFILLFLIVLLQMLVFLNDMFHVLSHFLRYQYLIPNCSIYLICFPKQSVLVL